MKEIPGGWPNSWWRRGSSPGESTLSVERLIQSFSYKQSQDIKKSFFFFQKPFTNRTHFTEATASPCGKGMETPHMHRKPPPPLPRRGVQSVRMRRENLHQEGGKGGDFESGKKRGSGSRVLGRRGTRTWRRVAQQRWRRRGPWPQLSFRQGCLSKKRRCGWTRPDGVQGLRRSSIFIEFFHDNRSR